MRPFRTGYWEHWAAEALILMNEPAEESLRGPRARHGKGTLRSGITAHQAAAAAAPHRSVRELLDQADEPDPKVSATRGNFSDFDLLFEQLAAPPVMELGKPAPEDRYLPKPRVGSCEAAHNRELLGDGPS